MRRPLRWLWRILASRLPVLYWLRRGRTYYQNRPESECEKSLHRELIDVLVPRRPRRVLEYGVGNGAVLKKIAAALPGVECCGVDISRTQLRAARQNFPGAEYRVSDLQTIDYPDHHFDVVLGLGVLIYLRPAVRRRVFRELFRVTRGRLVAVEYVTAYFDAETRRRFLNAGDFRYDYDIEEEIRRAGFRVEEARKIGAGWDPAVNRAGEMPHGLIVAAKGAT